MSNPTGKGGFGERKAAINKKGRPRSFDALRELAKEIAHEPLTIKDKDHPNDPPKPLLVNGKQVTTTEFILRKWANSQDFRQQQAFIEIAYGKVPIKTEVTGADGGPVQIQTVEIVVDDDENPG
jgi:hypothetical protein